MSTAERLHRRSLASFNDTLFRSRHERTRSRRDSFLSEFRSYVKYCVKPAFGCNNRYRSYSGVCNNARNPKWGAADSCLLRLLPANYGDGLAKPVELPPASSVSVKLRALTAANSSVEGSLTDFFFAFGQFLDHDVANSVISEVDGGDCCARPTAHTGSQCEMRLDVSGDAFYARYNVTCVNFIRAARCPCRSGPRDQMNGASSYIDLSQVYGSDDLVVDFLKDVARPHLLRTEHDTLLPTGGLLCTSERCFVGGDSRINQQAALTTLHTLFVRNHNFLARTLRRLNPEWTSFLVFEEARNINIAQFQVIVLKEFLPQLLGEELLQRARLNFARFLRAASVYDDTLEPGMFNEFLTAAFRLHTMIPATLGKSAFRFFNVDAYFNNEEGGSSRDDDYATSIVTDLVASRAREAAFPVSDVVAHHIYDTDGDYGLDLVAINIQRGRDHGLRPYVDYLARLRNITVTTFEHLSKLMHSDAVDVLRSVYKNVTDVDFYVGGYLERKASGVLSATMAEIVAQQFDRIIRADRFFVTHRKYFTRSQLKTLMRTSSADIFCATTSLVDVPSNPFLIDSKTVACAKKRSLNLDLWKS